MKSRGSENGSEKQKQRKWGSEDEKRRSWVVIVSYYLFFFSFLATMIPEALSKCLFMLSSTRS